MSASCFLPCLVLQAVCLRNWSVPWWLYQMEQSDSSAQEISPQPRTSAGLKWSSRPGRLLKSVCALVSDGSLEILVLLSAKESTQWQRANEESARGASSGRRQRCSFCPHPLFYPTVPEGATHTWGFFHIHDGNQNTSSAEAPYSDDSNV